MADITTVTSEIESLSIDIAEALPGGDSHDVVKVLQKMIDKIDELTKEINTIKSALTGE